MNPRQIRHVLLVTLMALMMAACGAAPPAVPTPIASDASAAPTAPVAPLITPTQLSDAGATLRISVPFLSQPLDPASGGGFNAIQFGVGETLMKLDPTFAPIPWLADALTARDARTWEIRLREGALFHDQTPVDANAVKASLERAIETIPTAKTLLDVESIAVVDERTLTITTVEPSPRMPGLLTEPSLTIVNVNAIAALGAEAFTRQPVMTGPFIVERFEQDQELALVRHTAHWQGTPASSRIVINVQPDATARFLALQSGQVDIAIDIRPESVAVAEGDANLRVVPAQPVATMFMYLNQRKAPWQDAKVRRALAHAVPPREALVTTVLRGQGLPAIGPIPSTVLPCPDLSPAAHDPEQARALLAEAGFVDSDGDGLVENSGAPLKLIVLSYPQRPALTPMAEIIQAQLKDIGIQMEIQVVEQINDALANQEWDAAMYFNNMAATGDPYGSLAQFYTAEGSSNRGGYANAAVEQQIEALRPVEDRAERLARSCAISQSLLDDVAIIPLVYPNYTYAAARTVQGFDQAHPYFLYFVNGALGIS